MKNLVKFICDTIPVGYLISYLLFFVLNLFLGFFFAKVYLDIKTNFIKTITIFVNP